MLALFYGVVSWVAWALLGMLLMLCLLLLTPLRSIPLFFAFALGISIERAVPFLFALRFPRSTFEALQRPQQMFNLLLESAALPHDARLVSLQHLSEAQLVDEPAKNETSGGLRISFTTAEDGHEQIRTLPFFLKFQCGEPLTGH
eukprot:SAG31_NODE_10881_length_1088_cov_0.993933_2_plen_145_part_00